MDRSPARAPRSPATAAKLSVSTVLSPDTTRGQAPPRGHGTSLLRDALSPSGRQILQDFLDVVADPHDEGDGDNGHDRRVAASLAHERHESAILKTLAVHDGNSNSFVQIQCNTRPFCLNLVEKRGEIVVTGFTPDLRSGAAKGVIEKSGRVLPGDVLIAINDEMEALTNVKSTVDALVDAQLPAVLTFRRVPVVKATLGEYSSEDIQRNLGLRGSTLLNTHSVEDAALLVQAVIEVLDDTKATTPLATYIPRVEKLIANPRPGTLNGENKRLHVERIQQMMQSIHRLIEAQQKEQLKQWNAVKPSNHKRIEILAKQRASIDKKLESMRANPSELQPDNHAVWQEYIELRHLSGQMRDSVEKAKREHYLPNVEGYNLRFGNDGIYVGIGDIWIPSFYAKFTVETRSSAPHLFVHLSTPATHGLKLRAKNFTLSTEGRLPSFHCDELNIEAQLIADIPLVFDEIHGWSVPQEELHVKLMSLIYYERQAHSTKKGQNHDVVMKMFINRLLPSVVRHAAQNLLCGELGPLLESRSAQVFLSGEIKIQGRKLALYDISLNPADLDSSSSRKDRDLTEEARDMMAISEDEASVLYSVFRAMTDPPPTKKKTFGFSPPSEPKRLSIRSLLNYFEQFKTFPHLRALTCELWSQNMELLSSSSPSRVSRSPAGGASVPCSSFGLLFKNLELLNEYPVDISVSLLDMTFRLDLCEGAATYYTTLQRIIRQEMDSTAIGLANFDSMRDGTFLENKLESLDAQYEKINRLLAFITTNVDDCGVILRGGMPAGFMSEMMLEATDLACKGPCGGSFTIPLTDLANLHNGVELNPKKDEEDEVPSATALTHENGALVFSKFFLQPNTEGDSLDEEKVPLNGDASSGYLPSDRLQVRVTNTSARVLFELPTELERLEGRTSFVPFSFTLVTNDANEPPRLQIETGEFAKCQYKAEQIAARGSVWQFMKKGKESAGNVLHPETSTRVEGTDQSVQSGSTKMSEAQEEESGSVWEDYVESPFFSLKFHFFTSCQVTREHMYWSIKSASLTEPKVAQVRHRLSLVLLLQDFGMLSMTNAAESTRRRKRDAQFRRALLQKATFESRHGHTMSFSDRGTQFSRTSVTETNDEFDRLSETMTSVDADSYDHIEKDDFQFPNGIEAFEEEDSGEEDSDDDEEEDDELRALNARIESKGSQHEQITASGESGRGRASSEATTASTANLHKQTSVFF
ncbi:hypothetical protein FI667_g10097, partial [Globisporangium splendens]